MPRSRSFGNRQSQVENPKRPVVGYVRVSTERQATEGVSLEAQEARIKAWCEFSDGELIGVFVDAGLSGGRADNRPELQKALDSVCKRKGVLVVYSITRLSRSVRDTLSIVDRLDRAGADLVSLTEKFDTTTAAGRLVFKVLVLLAEFEREQLSERTSAAMQHMRSQGKRVGTIPYGYQLAADGVALEKIPAEQEVIGRILKMRAGGETFRAICQSLDKARIPPKTGRKWHPSVVMYICKWAPGLGFKQPVS